MIVFGYIATALAVAAIVYLVVRPREAGALLMGASPPRRSGSASSSSPRSSSSSPCSTGRWATTSPTSTRAAKTCGVERGVYRLIGVDPASAQTWQAYLRGVLVFSVDGRPVRLRAAAPAGRAPLLARPARRCPRDSRSTRRSRSSRTPTGSRTRPSSRWATRCSSPGSRCRTSSRRPSASPSRSRSSAASPRAAPTPSATSGSTWCAASSGCCCPCRSSRRSRC